MKIKKQNKNYFSIKIKKREIEFRIRNIVAIQLYKHYPKKCVSLKITGFDFLIKVEPFFQI